MAKGQKGFVKGVATNPNGRPAGSANKTTAEARALFVSIMNDEVENIKEALQKIRIESPVRYIDALSKLFQYTIPKQLDLGIKDETIRAIKLIRGNEGTDNKTQQDT